MDARSYMEQVQRINAMIKNKVQEAELWRHRATDISATLNPAHVSSSNSPSKMEHIIVTYLDIEKDISQELKRLQERKKEVQELIEQLPAKEYDVLHQVYFQGVPLYEIADAFERSYSWVTSMHGRALKSVQKILDEKENARKESAQKCVQ